MSNALKIKQLISSGRIKEAISLCSNSDLDVSEKSELLCKIGRFFFVSNNFKFAESYFLEAMSLGDYIFQRRAFIELIVLKIKLKDYHYILEISKRFIGDDEKDFSLNAIKAFCFAFSGRYAESFDLIVRLEGEIDSGGEKFFTLALRYLVNGLFVAKPTSSIDINHLRLMLEKFKDHPAVQMIVGEALIKAGHNQEGVDCLVLANSKTKRGPRKEAILKKIMTEVSNGAATVPEGTLIKFLESPALKKNFTVAAITNVYNETHNMKVWLDHYGRQVGSKNCIVLDHGSNDGSTDDVGSAGIVHLARGLEFNEHNRMRLINDFANGLLGYYDAVIYSDCDEMLVADPDHYENLVEYARKETQKVSFAIGLNVRHNPFNEADLHDGDFVLNQRSLVQFTSPMCKPLIIKDKISWGGGFHCCQYPPEFNELYLFHLRHADKARALSRLNTTREIKFSREGAGKHHRRDAGEVVSKVFDNVPKYSVVENFDFKAMTDEHKLNCELVSSGRYACQKKVRAGKLNRIPERFKNTF